MLFSSHKGKLKNSNTSWPIHNDNSCAYISSTTKAAPSAFQVGPRNVLSCIALSYLGRQNEHTFVGAMSYTCQKGEPFVLITNRLFLVHEPILYLSKTGTKCFWPIAWLMGFVSDLILDSRLYPFLTSNGPGMPVFGYCPLVLSLLLRFSWAIWRSGGVQWYGTIRRLGTPRRL